MDRFAATELPPVEAFHSDLDDKKCKRDDYKHALEVWDAAKCQTFGDYHDLPLSDAKDDGPLLAYLMDGKTMSLRDKGPIWMVFPYDQNPDYRTEETYSRSIWQLLQIDFVE